MSFVEYLLNRSEGLKEFFDSFFIKKISAQTEERHKCKKRPEVQLALGGDESGGDGDGGGEEQSPPPFYADLNREANDVFNKGFYPGVLRLNLKTKQTNMGVNFTNTITKNLESGTVMGVHQAQHEVSDFGLTLKEKWDTENSLSSDAIVTSIADGLKVTLESTFKPLIGTQWGKIKSAFINEFMALNFDVGLNDQGEVITDTAGVGKYANFLAGFSSRFDTANDNYLLNSLAFGYYTKNLVTIIEMSKRGEVQDVTGTIFKKLTYNTDAAFSVTIPPSNTSDALISVGARYKPHKDLLFYGKINNKAILGLSFQRKIYTGVHLLMCLTLDLLNLDTGGPHKAGLNLEIDPYEE